MNSYHTQYFLRCQFIVDTVQDIDWWGNWGPIQKVDSSFACVSANELNPPEGTECDHKVTKTVGRVNNLYAR